MEIEENKKVHLNYLTIIVGTKCNLKCAHCLGGTPEHMEMKPEYIESLIENITGIDEIRFAGYEISLYPATVEMILQKFVSKNVKINHVTFLTNAVSYSKELVRLFTWFRDNHTTYPNKAVFQISVDEFHYNNGFSKEKLENNIEKYKQALGNEYVHYNNIDNGLYIIGRAKNLKLKDIQSYNKVLLPTTGTHKVAFRAECKGEQNTCNNGKCICNCIVSDFVLLPNGYYYNYETEAFNALDTKDYTYAIGMIGKSSIYDMIHKYINNSLEDKKDVVFQNYNCHMWNIRYLLYRYLIFRDKAKLAFENDDVFLYFNAKKEMQSMFDTTFRRVEKITNTENISTYFMVLTQISQEFNMITTIGDDFFFHSKQKTECLNRIQNLYVSSSFNRKTFAHYYGMDYDLFMQLWQCYEDTNFNEYKNLANKIVNNEGVYQ